MLGYFALPNARKWLPAILIILCAGLFHAVTATAGGGELDLTARQQAASRQQINLHGVPATSNQARELAQAMGAPMAWLSDARLDAASEQVAAVKQLGVIRPLVGGRLTVLRTGSLHNPARPGTRFAREGAGEAGSVQLTLRFDPPAGPRHLSFHYRFLTAEYPKFADAGFRDEFSVQVTDSLGTRQIVGMDAADPNLAPVSMDNAGGTGFDLFADQAGQVLGDFKQGLPRAGISDWRRVSEPIAAEGPITLEFTLRDDGDGLVDTAVLLNALSLSSVRLEHNVQTATAAANLAGAPSGPVETALQCLYQGGIVTGAVADGKTRISVTYYGLPAPGTVTFSFANGSSAPLDGGFGEDRLATISDRTEPSDLGGLEGYAVYLVPEEFNRGGDETVGSRTIYMDANYVPDDPAFDPSTGHFVLELWRPPLVLVHGLWSKESTWNGSPLLSDGRLSTFKVNYERHGAASFVDNEQVPAEGIGKACHFTWANGAAMKQVDYVGHSMGGILGRNFNNAYPDLINKFISLNTPHTGSPLANLIVALRDQPPLPPWYVPWGDILTWAADKAGKPIDKGAIDDLAKGSAAINAIGATSIPSHALVGVGGSDLFEGALESIPGPTGVMFKILFFVDDDDTNPFAGIQHDLIVGRLSQQGGIQSSAYTVFHGWESIHTNAPRNPAYASKIVDLLNAPTTSSMFGQFPPPSILGLAPIPLAPATDSATAILPEGQVQISAPLDGTVFEPGDTITATVAPVGNFDLEEALVISSQDAVLLTAPNLTGTLEIPETFLGPLELSVMARASDGSASLSEEPVTVLVTTNLTLNAIRILERNLLLYDHTDRIQLTVIGEFSDGVSREVTHPVTGTTYGSADPGVAQVTATGLVMPVNEGVTTIFAQNGSLQDSVTLTVLTIDGVIFQDGFDG